MWQSIAVLFFPAFLGINKTVRRSLIKKKKKKLEKEVKTCSWREEGKKAEEEKKEEEEKEDEEKGEKGQNVIYLIDK